MSLAVVSEPQSDKRERILNAAAALIIENGLQCSMAAIAARAGVATGSLYNYFESKDELVRAVYERLAATITDALVTEIDRSLSHKQRIMRYVHAYIDFIWQDPERAVLFEYLSNVPLIPPQEMARKFSGTSRHTATLFSEGHRDGELKDFSPETMGAFIGGAIRNALKWHRTFDRKLTAEDRRQIGEMCWAAIAR